MKKFSILLISFVITCFAVIFAPIYAVRAEDGVVSVDLTVHFIDVGQGDACIVELPDGRTMLIDAGDNKKAVRSKLDEYITTNIKSSDGKVIEYFDFVILTHSDSDHIGSMVYVLEQYPAKTVYRPNQECKYNDCNDHANSGENERNRFWGESHGSKSTATYHNVLEAAYENSDEVIVTNPYDDSQNCITSSSESEPYTINFYSPLSPDYSDNNNYSPIIVIEYHSRKIVLTGDAEKENEKEFVNAVNTGIDPRYDVFDNSFCADVIKLGHHGSRTSSSEDYLNTVTKSDGRSGVFVIISCGEDNKYGHPHDEILERLSRLGFSDDNILRTDLLSDIVVTITMVDGQYEAVYNGKVGSEVGGNQNENENPSGGETSNEPPSDGEKPNGQPIEQPGEGGMFKPSSCINISFIQSLKEIDCVTLAAILMILLAVVFLKPTKKKDRR